MTKILVTGGSGFIGKHLIKKICSGQHEVIGVNSLAGDVADKNTWSNIEPTDVLVHLASNTYVPDSWKDPNIFFRTNFHGTVCALDYCRQHGTKLVYLSSYLYGNPSKLPILESAPLVATNPYALSKKLAEEVCRFYADSYGVKIIILRPFNVYGSGQSDRFLIPSLINQVRSQNTIIVQDLEPRRDYIYVDDLVDAIIKAMEIQLDFDVFNIGSGVSYSVAELIRIIQSIQGSSASVKVDGERRVGEVMNTQADISKALEILDWAPNYSITAGLSRLIKN